MMTAPMTVRGALWVVRVSILYTIVFKDHNFQRLSANQNVETEK